MCCNKYQNNGSTEDDEIAMLLKVGRVNRQVFFNKKESKYFCKNCENLIIIWRILNRNIWYYNQVIYIPDLRPRQRKGTGGCFQISRIFRRTWNYRGQCKNCSPWNCNYLFDVDRETWARFCSFLKDVCCYRKRTMIMMLMMKMHAMKSLLPTANMGLNIWTGWGTMFCAKR